MLSFTIIGYWPDTLQRFADCIDAIGPMEAEIACARKHPGVAICGVLQGKHQCVDASEYVFGLDSEECFS